MQRGKSGNERRYACAIYHSILSVRIELKKSSKFKEKLNSEQVADLRSFFFFGTFFFLCGEIEFLGKMGITLNTYKKNYNILHSKSNCSFILQTTIKNGINFYVTIKLSTLGGNFMEQSIIEFLYALARLHQELEKKHHEIADRIGFF